MCGAVSSVTTNDLPMSGSLFLWDDLLPRLPDRLIEAKINI